MNILRRLSSEIASHSWNDGTAGDSFRDISKLFLFQRKVCSLGKCEFVLRSLFELP